MNIHFITVFPNIFVGLKLISLSQGCTPTFEKAMASLEVQRSQPGCLYGSHSPPYPSPPPTPAPARGFDSVGSVWGPRYVYFENCPSWVAPVLVVTGITIGWHTLPTKW